MNPQRPASDPTVDADRPPWREPVRGGYFEPRHLALSGLERLHAMLAGDVAQPPLSHLTGMRLVDVAPGTTAFAMPMTDWLCSSQGPISIGPLTIPADAAVACAIQTELPPATPFTTSELSLRMLSPVGPGGTLTARGRLIQLRRRLSLAEVAVYDEQERVVAHGSSLCFVQPAVSSAPRASIAQPGEQDAAGTAAAGGVSAADPYMRPAQGEVLGQRVWERLSGLEVLRAQLAGELPLPPIHYLTGMALTAAEPGAVSFTMPASAWLCAPMRARVQGGAVALLAETALSSAIQAQLPAATALAAVDLKVNYLRPLTADDRLAVAHGRVVHAGRRIAVADAQVLDADGRPVAVATGSAMILPGRAASLGALES